MSFLMKTAMLSMALTCASAIAAPINIGSYTLLTGTDVVTFNEFPVNYDPDNASITGAVQDGIVISGGVAFGEHFSGQLLGASGNFDVLSGLPAGPLTLLAGAAGQNLATVPARVIDLPSLQFDSVLSGIGRLGNGSSAGTGEGAISILFSADQSQIGLQLVGLNGGNTFFSFFRSDGSLIQTFSTRAANNAYLGLFRDGQIKDIRGVSIWNDDPNGMAIDNLKHDVASNISAVPEAGSGAMLAAGLLLIGWVARRSAKVAPSQG